MAAPTFVPIFLSFALAIRPSVRVPSPALFEAVRFSAPTPFHIPLECRPDIAVPIPT